MSRFLASIALILAACNTTDAPDCETAAAHVTSCYGEEVGAAFAETCDPDAAAVALADNCGSIDEGKADSYGTPILTPAVEQFKYGSIGADKLGLPVALLRAMPLVCKDLLPAGADPNTRPLEAFGMIYEAGHDLPIGFSTRRLPIIGMQLAGTTCSTCHTATVRETPESPRSTVYMGAPNARFDVQRWNAFLLGCISDTSKFNATNLSRAFDQLGIYGLDRFLAYKTSFIRAFTDDLRLKLDKVVTDGDWGPGRDDAIGLSAALLLDPKHQPTIAAPIDYPAVWNQKARRGHALHWDGASGSAMERNVLVSVGAGTPKTAVPLESIGAIQNWLENIEAPKYPFAIDASLLARGAEVFAAQCQSCHGAGGDKLFQVVAVSELGTDPNRVSVITEAAITDINNLSGTGWAFDNFRKTDGYLSSLLDGIWLRAPYLHNGSVPTLRDLLAPPAERPATFYRGSDVYNKTDVGFVSNVAGEGAKRYTLIDTSRQGNRNGGHVYGTTLPQADKDALLEYLKTL